MTTTVRPVVFTNRNGLRLYGMLHLPVGNRGRDTGIIILSPGIKSRIAPHRLYVKMAERFVVKGFPVLRFDYHGLGDSDGEVNEKFVADFYGAMQRGRYVDDALAAVDWMEHELGIRRIILGGLCGGAITGLFAAEKDQRVVSLFGLGIPVILDGTNIDYYDFVSKGQLAALRGKYLRKIFEPKAWLRLLTFRSDFRLLFKSLFRHLPDTVPSGARNEEGKEECPSTVSDAQNGNFNRLFPHAFFSVVSMKKKILLVFSEKDRLYWEFEEKFYQPNRARIESHREFIDFHVTKDANHIFSFKEWQSDMMEKVCTWVEKNHSFNGIAPAIYD